METNKPGKLALSLPVKGVLNWIFLLRKPVACNSSFFYHFYFEGVVWFFVIGSHVDQNGFRFIM